VFLGWWGLVLLVGVMDRNCGAAPARAQDRLHAPFASSGVQAWSWSAGFLLTLVVLLSSNGIHVLGTRVTGPMIWRSASRGIGLLTCASSC